MEAKISHVLESIYESEIPCRIEWMYDMGFTWSIQNGQYPRVWRDDMMENNKKILCESPESMLERNNPFLEKDWIARGSNYSFCDAVRELAEKVVQLFPNCKFAKWYHPYSITTHIGK